MFYREVRFRWGVNHNFNNAANNVVIYSIGNVGGEPTWRKLPLRRKHSEWNVFPLSFDLVYKRNNNYKYYLFSVLQIFEQNVN